MYHIRMQRWGIDRRWAVSSAGKPLGDLHTEDLRRFRACVMLGAAGMGKSVELDHLVALDKLDHKSTHFHRLASLGQTEDGLIAKLHLLMKGLRRNRVLYLDALDEVMIPVRTSATILESWIRDNKRQIEKSQCSLRISCRSAVWYSGIEQALREVYSECDIAVAVLQPLSHHDVVTIANDTGLDGEAFLAAAEAAHANALTQHPLTLNLLIALAKEKDGAFPRGRKELLEKGVMRLAVDREERRLRGTRSTISELDLIDGAERLASFTLLSGREVIDLSDRPVPGSLGITDLGGLEGGRRPLELELLTAISRSGLCDSDGDSRFRFVHRQIAEYLAGRQLARLPLHQCISLLRSAAVDRSGVAGPLREVAAFTAMDSVEFADWLTSEDPEVVGLSDVANPELRRRATLGLLHRFRTQELADSQLSWDEIELSGLKYSDAATDLRAVLKERQSGCDDVLECAVKLVRNWRLSELSDDLADLVLDDQAPVHCRVTAGYALAEIGSIPARRRLLPLVSLRIESDPHSDLKGLALRCNWPGAISEIELFDAVKPISSMGHHGAYEGFLCELEQSGFDASPCRLEGLKWAKQFVSGSDHRWTTHIAKRIAISALADLDSPGVASAVVDLMVQCGEVHCESPLVPPQRYHRDKHVPREEPVLSKLKDARRRLLEEFSTRRLENHVQWGVYGKTPGLAMLDDFPWLIERACDTALPMTQREAFTACARMLPWRESPKCIEAWFPVRAVVPISTHLQMPLYMELDSEEASVSRRQHKQLRKIARSPRRKRLQPPPDTRVLDTLEFCETKDRRFFLNLCREMTLEEFSTEYGFERYLTSTPGWRTASRSTRNRIREAAKRLLLEEVEEPRKAITESLNSILPGYLPAMWLLLETEPEWLTSRDQTWWELWAWYILRELHPNMHKEGEAPKQQLLRLLHERVPSKIIAGLEHWAAIASTEAKHLFVSLLGSLEDIEDPHLDDRLSVLVRDGALPADRLTEAAQFVLSRKAPTALEACKHRLKRAEVKRNEEGAVACAIAMLHENARDCWEAVHSFCRHHPHLVASVFGRFAHGHRFQRSRESVPNGVTNLPFGHVGQLISLLFEAFRPEDDPDYGGRAHSVGPEDSARDLRNRLVSWLAEQPREGAVWALRALEQRFGSRYPWLRRPRARAERSFTLKSWNPVPPAIVAQMISAAERRLVQSYRDALDGVLEAIRGYQRCLRRGIPGDLEDLWHLPAGTPRDEERVSDKICGAIRAYFDRYAVVSAREVQIYRRKLPSHRRGAPGSNLDVWVSIPARGTVREEEIRIPIEVKLAHNREARTNLQSQLVDRYIREDDASGGVFVVAWMGRTCGKRHACWPTPRVAAEEIHRQADRAMSAASTMIDIRTIVVDAALPQGATRRRVSKGSTKKSRRTRKPDRAAVRRKRRIGARPRPKGSSRRRNARRR